MANVSLLVAETMLRLGALVEKTAITRGRSRHNDSSTALFSKWRVVRRILSEFDRTGPLLNDSNLLVLYRSVVLLRFVDRVDENVETRRERHEAHRHSHRPQDHDFDARRGAQRRRGPDETRPSQVPAGCQLVDDHRNPARSDENENCAGKRFRGGKLPGQSPRSYIKDIANRSIHIIEYLFEDRQILELKINRI